MSDRDALKLFFRRCLGTYSYLNQGVVWYPKPPAEPMRIDEMDAEWRYNCARMLLRNAAAYADRYSWGEIQTPALFGLSDDNADDLTADMERWDAERLADPQGWIRTTALYQALVKGLPGKPQKLYRLSQRARHWAACPARRSNAADCSCQTGEAAAVPATPAPVLVVAPAAAAPSPKPAPQPVAVAQPVRDPNIDPSTSRPWGIDPDGINHKEAHSVNDHCPYDSCSYCGGYHCGWYCSEAHS